MKNNDFDALLENPIFGGKMGMATTLAPKSLGPQELTKKLAHWMKIMVQLLSQKTFQNKGLLKQYSLPLSQVLFQLLSITGSLNYV